ncbi:hypothetical protein [Shimia sp. R9_3]|uniref:hypothetical protein n=1 Tax=Shimia sp. R9_3 TaxID=2821113 RepID=UPI001FFE1A64|nr:hypothetical protein [Shimia sp. R9_3]
MRPFAQSYTPAFMFDVSSVENAGQHFIDTLVANFFAIQVFGEARLAFQEALHFDLCLEASARVAFKRCL